MKKQFFSVLLVICMLACLIPVTNVFAAGKTYFLDRKIFRAVILERIKSDKVTALEITGTIPKDTKTYDLNEDGSIKCYVKSEKGVKTAKIATEKREDSICFPEDSSYFFAFLPLENIDLTGTDTSNVSNMNGMFSSCHKVKSINLNDFDTTLVKTMKNMFFDCENLEKLYLGDFNVSNVEDMSYMFNGCEKLKSLDTSRFDVNFSTNCQGMFRNCKKLEEPYLRGFRNVKKENLYQCFSGCPVSDELLSLELGLSRDIDKFSGIFGSRMSLPIKVNG